MFTNSLQRFIALTAFVIGLTLLLFGAAHADPAGRTVTTNVWVPDSWAWQPALVGPGRQPCYPGNPGPWDECESGGYDGSKDSDPRCPGVGGPPCADGQRYSLVAAHWETTTITYPPATVAASFSCIYGANGWCLSPGTLTITGVEPVASYSIYQVAYTRNGAPISCAGSSCAITVSDTPGETFSNFQAFSTFGDSSYTDSTLITAEVDTLPPTVSCAPAGALGLNGWYVSDVTVTCTASDATSGVASNTFDGNPYTNPVIISTQGNSAHDFTSTDMAGNSAVQTVTFAIDSVAPVSAITSHTDKQVIFGTVTFSGTASDATLAYPAGQASGVRGVELSTNNGATWQPVTGTPPSDSIGGWSYTLDTTILPDGAQTLLVRSTDNAGNVQAPATSLTLIVDNLPPEVALDVSCPKPGRDGWCWTPVTLSIAGSDAGSGVTSLTYDYRGEMKTIPAASISFSEGQGGEFSINAFATDRVGRHSTTASAAFKIDGAPPVARFLGGDRSQLLVDISDFGSGIEHWTLQVFDAKGQPIYWREYSAARFGAIAWDGAMLAGGVYSVELFARDRAGLEFHAERMAFTLPGLTTSTPTQTQVAGVSIIPSPMPPWPTRQGRQSTAPSTLAPTPILSPSPSPTTVVPVSRDSVVPPAVPDMIAIAGIVSRNNSVNEGWFTTLLLLTGLGLLLAVMLPFAFDRRPSAIRVLVKEIDAAMIVRRKLEITREGSPH